MPYADPKSETARACRRRATAKWKANHPTERKASAARTNRAQYEKNKEQRNAYSRWHHARNRAAVSARRKIYRAANRAKLLLGMKKWYEANKLHVLESNRQRTAKRKQIDPGFKVLLNLRGRISKLLAGRVKKVGTTRQLIGCDTEDLWKHLEAQFKPGMNRDNYGTVWHVDHIQPCAHFDFTISEHQRACFHFSNLQPLFAFDNLSKGKRPNYACAA